MKDYPTMTEEETNKCHKAYGCLPGEKIDGLLKVTKIYPNGCEIELENSGRKIILTDTQAGELANLMSRVCYSMGFMSVG
jgi:hypothetical protein